MYAAACAGLCVLVYVLAFGSTRLRARDLQTLGSNGGAPMLASVRRTSAAIIATIDVGGIVFLGGALVAVALLRRRPDAALAAVVAIVGANATTWIAKPLLEHLDPLGGDALRTYHGTFPSGHATIAMSVAAAAVLAAPARLRAFVAPAGALYAVAVGVSLMAQQWHYASDVAGGFLVAGCWGGLAALLLAPDTRSRGTPLRAVYGILVPLGLAFVAAVAVAVRNEPSVLYHMSLHKTFLAAAVVLLVLALAELSALARLLD